MFLLGFTLENEGKTKEALQIYKSISEKSGWFVEAQRRILSILKKEDRKKAKIYLLKLSKKEIKDIKNITNKSSIKLNPTLDTVKVLYQHFHHFHPLSYQLLKR